MFSFLMPLLEVIKIIIASVASVVFLGFGAITLAGSTVALALSTPLFIIFSPVLVPATIATAVLATGFTAGSSLAGSAVGLIVWLIKRRMGIKGKDNPPPSPPVPGIPGIGNASVQTLVEKPKPKGESKLPDFIKKIPGVSSIMGDGKSNSIGKGHKAGGRKCKSKLKGGMSGGEGGTSSGGEGLFRSNVARIYPVGHHSRGLKGKGSKIGMSGSEGGMSGSDGGMSGSEGGKSRGVGHHSRGLRGKGSKRGKSGSEGGMSGSEGGMSGCEG